MKLVDNAPSRRSIASVLVGAVILVVSGTVVASAGTSPTVYNGCENVATGIIRLLPSSLPPPYNTTCNTTTKSKGLLETPISWNQVGPTGPTGATGATGPSGHSTPDTIGGAADPHDSVPAGNTSYVGLFGSTGYTFFAAQSDLPTAGTLSNFYFNIAALEGTGTVTATLYKNDAATSVTCTMDATTATECQDTTDSVAFVQGDVIAVRVDNTGNIWEPANWSATYQQ